MSVNDDPEDWAMLHYAVGILMGLGHKHGVIDVVIYHNGIRVQVERVTITTEVRDGKSEPRTDR